MRENNGVNGFEQSWAEPGMDLDGRVNHNRCDIVLVHWIQNDAGMPLLPSSFAFFAPWREASSSYFTPAQCSPREAMRNSHAKPQSSQRKTKTIEWAPYEQDPYAGLGISLDFSGLPALAEGSTWGIVQMESTNGAPVKTQWTLDDGASPTSPLVPGISSSSNSLTYGDSPNRQITEATNGTVVSWEAQTFLVQLYSDKDTKIVNFYDGVDWKWKLE